MAADPKLSDGNPENFTRLTHVSSLLTNDELNYALTKWFNKDMIFTHWEYVGGTGKGDSYLSDLIRIKIFGKDSNGDSNYVQVILKTIPKSISRRLTFRIDEFFKNEIKFYTRVLPKLLEFQATKDLKVPFDNYTKLFHAKYDGENDFLILEDVTTQSFGPAIRQKGIDLDHCTVTLKTFAKFHAISFAMRDQSPEEFERISNQLREVYYDQRLKGWYKRFWKTICGIAIDAIEKEHPKYLKEIKRFSVPETYDNLCETVIESRKHGVISHGDSWTNNFLYKYLGDRKPLDAKMIDFQLARCGSPVLDTSFFIYTCTTQEVRERHYFELLEYYYNILSSQIAEMGSDPLKVYSWESFMDEIKRYSFFGLAFSFESMPVIVLEPEDTVNMEMKGDQKVDMDDVWQMQPFKTKEGRLREADNIMHAVEHGYI